jgi:hypothetical protein
VRALHAQHHDAALELAHFGDAVLDLTDQRVELLWRELQVLEHFAQFLKVFLYRRALAIAARQRAFGLVVLAADVVEAAARFLHVQPAVVLDVLVAAVRLILAIFVVEAGSGCLRLGSLAGH